MGAWHTKCPDKTPIRMPRPDRPYSQPQTTAKPKLLDQVRGVLRRKHYSIRTEQSYVDWIKRFILFNHLAVEQMNVAAPQTWRLH